MSQSDEYLGIFYKLHPALLLYVNQELKIFPQIKSVEALRREDQKKTEQIRNALWKDPGLIGRYPKSCKLSVYGIMDI